MSGGWGQGAHVERPGFTLLELLVVVALIVLLAGFLLPVLARAREQGRRTICLANLQQIGRAQVLYLQDWDERFPHWVHHGPARDDRSGPWVYWTEFLQPYLRSKAVFGDPSAVRKQSDSVNPVLADYALLTWRQSGHRGDAYEPCMRFPGPPIALPHVVRPAETMNLMDGWTTASWTEGSVRRHSRGTNASFVDGHVRWLTDQELWRTDLDERGFYWLHYGAAER